jgi:hypothetical protein
VRIQFLVFGLVLSIFSFAANAGSGHSHSHSSEPVTEAQATQIATDSVRQLAVKGKLESSWARVKAAGVEQKTYGSKKEWVVVFNNGAVSDGSKRKLYVFLTLTGEYLAANFTGE